MRTLTKTYLGGLPLDKEEYEADFAVVDKHQSFSAELLRLSLLGIAGYAFLITDIVLKVNSETRGLVMGASSGKIALWSLIMGAVAFGTTAAASLGHRDFATDCITPFVRRLRAQKQHSGLPEGHLDGSV